LSKGSKVLEICRKIGIAEQSFYQAKLLKKVEKENTRLKKLVADLSLDKAILKEVAEGKY
jgi:hypothetical protein